MIPFALLLQAAAPAPSAEAAALGQQVAEVGTFSRLAPLLVAQETEQLVRDTPGLTPAEQT